MGDDMVTRMADAPNSETPGYVPTTEEALARLDMPLGHAMLTQRAVRRVLPDPVADEIVAKCLELALQAPTGANGQQWEFVVVSDHLVKAQLAKNYRRIWKLYYTFYLKRIAARDESMAKTARAVQWQVDHFEEIPVLVVACMRFGVHDGRVPFVRMPHAAESGYWGSIYPAVQNLLLAARAMGLGASLVTLPLWNIAATRRLLRLPRNTTACCVVPLGWPRGRYGPTTRKAVGDVTHVDRYGNRAWQTPTSTAVSND